MSHNSKIDRRNSSPSRNSSSPRSSSQSAWAREEGRRRGGEVGSAAGERAGQLVNHSLCASARALCAPWLPDCAHSRALRSCLRSAAACAHLRLPVRFLWVKVLLGQQVLKELPVKLHVFALDQRVCIRSSAALGQPPAHHLDDGLPALVEFVGDQVVAAQALADGIPVRKCGTQSA